MEKSEEYGAVCSATALKMLSWCQLLSDKPGFLRDRMQWALCGSEFFF